MDNVTRSTVEVPPRHGPGSSRAAWIAFALDIGATNPRLWRLVNEQSAVIRSLEAEVALLKRQIAERKPPGGRAPLAENTVARIEQEIEHGGTDRSIAARYRVSHMSVYRIRKRMRQRERTMAA